MLDDVFSFFNNVLCGVAAVAGCAIILSECSSGDSYDSYDPYSGAQPGIQPDYDNTLPPTYEQ